MLPVNFISIHRILRKARLAADEDRAATKRRSEETLYMLKDPARKHMNAERLKAGALRRRGYLSAHEAQYNCRSGDTRRIIWTL